jgi:riboflavin kinase / FMN adenylyltransferase
MRIIRGLKEAEKANLDRPVVTLGNFDGVHLGHQEIFRRAAAHARAQGGTSVAFTFEPHPLKVVAPQRSPKLLSTFHEKMERIREAGIDAVICARFTPEFAETTPEEFVRDILSGMLHTTDLFIGHDYAFGKGRKGDIPFLSAAGERYGFGVHVVEPVTVDGILVSSTNIRRLVTEGDVKTAAKLLGRPYSIEGMVVHGHSRGHALGYPTANIATPNELPPKEGVYAVRLTVAGKECSGAASIGTNPTFEDAASSFEVHIFEFDGNLYGKHIKIKFIERLRDGVKFSSADELSAQIKLDIERTKEVLAAYGD